MKWHGHCAQTVTRNKLSMVRPADGAESPCTGTFQLSFLRAKMHMGNAIANPTDNLMAAVGWNPLDVWNEPVELVQEISVSCFTPAQGRLHLLAIPETQSNRRHQ
jgi:hypothetical protein